MVANASAIIEGVQTNDSLGPEPSTHRDPHRGLGLFHSKSKGRLVIQKMVILVPTACRQQVARCRLTDGSKIVGNLYHQKSA